MQSRVIGLLTGHKTMRKCLYILGLKASLWCRSYRPEEETSAHVLWECEALVTLSLNYLGCSLMDPEDVLNLSLGATGTLLTLNTLTWKIWWAPNNGSRWQMGFNSAFKGLKEQDSHDLVFHLQEYTGPVKGPHASGQNRLQSIVFSVLFYSITLHIE